MLSNFGKLGSMAKAKTKAKPKVKPLWQFLWCDADDRHRVFHERYYHSPTLRQACDRMLAWAKRQEFEVIIDYEARACHASPRARHEDIFPDLTQTEHPIRELLNAS
jgi:hypothetical protein